MLETAAAITDEKGGIYVRIGPPAIIYTVATVDLNYEFFLHLENSSNG